MLIKVTPTFSCHRWCWVLAREASAYSECTSATPFPPQQHGGKLQTFASHIPVQWHEGPAVCLRRPLPAHRDLLLTVLEPQPLRVQPQLWGKPRKAEVWAPPPRSTLFAEAIKVGHKVNLPGEGRVQRLPIHRIAPCIFSMGVWCPLACCPGQASQTAWGRGHRPEGLPNLVTSDVPWYVLQGWHGPLELSASTQPPFLAWTAVPPVHVTGWQREVPSGHRVEAPELRKKPEVFIQIRQGTVTCRRGA
ncbi:hypothetical protein J6590_055631 [Homalodisca vitripennis]|nr:hypothetical protein J6590_055631 [Homalodisca vitripennis]